MAASQPVRYASFGLHVVSDVPLDPYLERAWHEAAPDVRVRRGPAPAPAAPSDLVVEWQGGTRVVFRAGSDVYVEPGPDVSPDGVAEQLGSVLLAVVIERAGTFVLHGSAVVANGVAVAFTGASGAGKSSTAGLLAGQGFPMLVDDFLPIAVEGDRAICRRGPSLLKLRDDALAGVTSLSVGGEAALSGKRLTTSRPTSGPPLPDEVELCAIYVIEDGPEVAVKSLAGQEALTTLLRHAFCLPVLHGPSRTAHLIRCAEVARRVPVGVLARPRDWERRDELIRWFATTHGGATNGRARR